MKPQQVFLWLSLVAGFATVLLTPPFQVPDEAVHFFRAYGISEGYLEPKIVAGKVGEMLPAALVRLARSYNRLVMNPAGKTSSHEIHASRDVRIVSDQRELTEFGPVGSYWFVSYIPQALGIAAVRPFTDRALDLLYAARVANLIVASVLCFIAIAIVPCFRWVLTLLALMPMTVFLRSSVSPDTLVIALAFLTFSVAIRLLERATVIDLGMLTLIGALLALMKPYGMVAWLALANQTIWKVTRLRCFAVAIVLITVSASALLAWHMAAFPVTMSWGTDPARQLAAVGANPIRFMQLAARDYIQNGRWYVGQMVGNLGWLDTPLPTWLMVGYAILLIFAALINGPSEMRLSAAKRLYILVLVTGLLGVISLSQYLNWTAVGAETIQGIQGRYFIPVAPAALFLLTSRRLSQGWIRRILPTVSTISAVTALIVMIICLLQRYYISPR